MEINTNAIEQIKEKLLEEREEIQDKVAGSLEMIKNIVEAFGEADDLEAVITEVDGAIMQIDNAVDYLNDIINKMP